MAACKLATLTQCSQTCGLRRSVLQQPRAASLAALPPAAARRPQLACHASKKRKSGDGGGARRSGGNTVGSGSEAHRLQDTIRESRQQQLVATDLLAKLLQADNPQQVATEYVDSLDEQFFWTVNTYLTMAKKEDNADVVSRLEAALKGAFEAKQATLRPEIQLLNRLLATESGEQRMQVLGRPEAGEQLVMSDRYFFQLLDRMLADVKRQPEGKQKVTLLAKLESIQMDAQQRAGPGAAAAEAASQPAAPGA